MNKIFKKFKRCKKGQALTELAITLPIYTLLLWGVIFFARWLITDIKLQMAVRTAVWLCVYDDQSEDVMRAKAVELTNQIGWGEVVGEIDVFDGAGWPTPAHVEIRYRIPVPGILREILGAGGWINLTARNEVFNETWVGL